MLAVVCQILICGVSYFMKNTGNVKNTQNIEFNCENPRNKDIESFMYRIVLKKMGQLIFHDW